MAIKKGIIVAGGLATRLHPASLAFGKPFLPIYDKPMIYYSLSILLMAGIDQILIVTSPRDHALFKSLLGDGSQWGASISFVEQPVADGIAGAFLLGEDFIAGDGVCLILGDNFFYGEGLAGLVRDAAENNAGATVFCAPVENPAAYGVAAMEDDGTVTTLVEKPKTFISNWAVTGLYFYDSRATGFAKTLQPSARGELEVTDLNKCYLDAGALKAVLLEKDFCWFDTGTNETMFEAAVKVRDTLAAEGVNIGCPDEAAFKAGLIDRAQVLKNAEAIKNPAYADYLRKVAGE
ncbi:MAG: NTP transferase domain-containing protein [Alphaproteobacteria bacterium]|nr:NTP transferase domain-containing protein [Alphaproteobacteria bacterium]